MAHAQTLNMTLERNIDHEIIAIGQARSSIMFSHLADALPHHTWHTLFKALSRLTHQHRIQLLAHRWDYEVIYQAPPPSSRDTYGDSYQDRSGDFYEGAPN